MSQNSRQIHEYEDLTVKRLNVREGITLERQTAFNIASDVSLEEKHSGLNLRIVQNGVRVTLPIRPRASTTFKIQNTVKDCTMLIVLSKEDAMIGGGFTETSEGTSIRLLRGSIGEEITLTADGIDGFVVTHIAGQSWSLLPAATT